jgi:hypothetical protein
VDEGKPIEGVGTASDMRATSWGRPKGLVVSQRAERSNPGHDHQIIVLSPLRRGGLIDRGWLFGYSGARFGQRFGGSLPPAKQHDTPLSPGR